MSEFQLYLPTPEQKQGEIWVEKITLHHMMEPCEVGSFFPNGCFISFYHRPIEIIDDGGLRECPSGTMIAWEHGKPVQQGHRTHQWENSYIILRGPLAEEILATFPCNCPLSITDQDEVLRMYDAVFKELSEFHPSDPRIIRNLIVNLLLFVRRDAGLDAPESRIPKSYLDIRQYISNNYHKALRLRDLADMLSISETHFSKSFKRHFSCAPIAYLIRVRMEQAAYLLQDREVRVSEVAERVGFENIYYFSRMVKKFYGVSPRALRTKLMMGNH